MKDDSSPDASPTSQGAPCPRGAASFQLVTGTPFLHPVLYRRPGGQSWESIPFVRAVELIADRVEAAGGDPVEEEGDRVFRTLGSAHLGGVTLGDEQNELARDLFDTLGIVRDARSR